MSHYLYPLLAHQAQGVKFILDRWAAGSGAALFHEMGTGKTYTALTSLVQAGVQRALVVAPVSVLPVWKRENQERLTRPFQVYTADEFSLAVDRGTTDGRALLLISYESMWRRVKLLREFRPEAVILDESHRIKSPKAKQSKFAHTLVKIPKRLALTGTPIAQSPLDAWSQVRVLDPALLGDSYYAFRNRYAVVEERKLTDGRRFQKVTSYKNLGELGQRLRQVGHFVTKAEAIDLPPKTHIVRAVQLSAEELRAYEAMRKLAVVSLEQERVVTAAHVTTQLLRLQTLANGWIASQGRIDELGSSKLDELGDLLTGELSGQPTVVFAWFRHDLVRIAAQLAKLGIQYFELTGDTSAADREKAVAAFQAGERTVFLAQQKVGGYGITLTRASHVIYYGLTWSVEAWLQSQDRIHRVGQRWPCTYVYLQAAGTVEEKIYQAVLEKRALAERVTNWKELF